MNLSINKLKFSVIYLSLVGFPIIGVLAQILNIESYFLSVILRTIVASLSIVLFFICFKYFKIIFSNLFLFLFFIFIFIYSFRLIVDTLIINSPLLHYPSYYWIWFFGVCLLPFLVVILSRDNNFLNKRSEVYIYLSFLVVTILSIIYGSSYLESEFNYDSYNSGRFRLNSINPISLGHIGVILFSLSYLYLDFNKGKKNIIIAISGILLGFYLSLLANSRGPLVALLFIFVFLTVKKYRYFYIVLPVVFYLIFLLFFMTLNFIGSEYDIQTLNRIYGNEAVQNSLEDDRLTLYRNAIEGFINNPIFGSGLEEYKFGFYPHNIYIESFMATGFIGGLCFVLTSSYAIFKSLFFDLRYLWVSIFYIDNFISGMFSGAIYSSGYFWISLSLVFSVILFSKNSLRVN